MDNYPDLPTPVCDPPTGTGLFSRAEQYAQAYNEPGFTEPSPWGQPVKSAAPVPAKTVVATPPPVSAPAPKVRSPKARKDPAATSAGPKKISGDKPKPRFAMSMPKLSAPSIGIPDQLNALITPTACSLAAWSIAANIAGTATQGVIAMAIMSAIPITLLWFMMGLSSVSLKVKIGVFGMVLLPVAVMFLSLVTVAPYSLLALVSYWLYFPSTRGWLRRSTTWFSASAIAWSLTIFFA